MYAGILNYFLFFSVGVNNGPSELYTSMYGGPLFRLLPSHLLSPIVLKIATAAERAGYLSGHFPGYFHLIMKIKISMLMLFRYIFAHISV